MFLTRTRRLLQQILKQSIMLRMRQKPGKHWAESMKNGLPNTPIPWNDGMITGMLFPLFLSSQQPSGRLYIRPNSIESLNATYRKLNRQGSVFPSDTALLKALHLSTFEATRKWTTTIRSWTQVYGELSIMYHVWGMAPRIGNYLIKAAGKQ